MEKVEVPGVRRVIAVASGKGGVGKSTVASNIALGLARLGIRSGLLDADIYGPSQGMMMGVPEGTRPEVADNLLKPVIAHDVQVMSMGFVTTDKTPAVWRGPMASGAMQQLMLQTAWDEVDTLVVDMPPGTGDIQLTLVQKASVDGVVVVTTPQDIALLDARKAIEMFSKVSVPILGVVENMSLHVCSQCGHQEPIFGHGGGESVAQEYGTIVLGKLPLAMSIRVQSDGGEPAVIGDPQGEISGQFGEIVTKMIGQLDVAPHAKLPDITISDD